MLLTLLFLALGSVVPALASPPDAARRTTGTIEVRSETEACPGRECYEFTVSCPEVASPARGRLKVDRPEGATRRGTILFPSGGFGKSLYEGGKQQARILADLREAGFMTVQLQWLDSWLIGSPGELEGHVRLACRPATVARWIHDHLHESGSSRAYCATGHSGGAAQISYMLTHYGLEDILDAVVPTGGPPMSRMDLSCDRSHPDRDIVFLPAAISTIDAGFGFLPAGDLDQHETWDQEGTGPCARGDASFREQLRKASVASGEGDYFYPATMVWFVQEGIDKSHAAAIGNLYYEILERNGSPFIRKDVVPDVTHGGFYRSQEAANMVRDILLSECRRRTQ